MEESIETIETIETIEESTETIEENINTRDHEGNTKIHAAAMHGDTELQIMIIRVLIDRGADIELKNNKGHTPLYEAVFWERTEIVKELLSARANIRTRDDFGNTLLHVVAKSGNVEIAKKLLAAGADINAQNNRGLTPSIIVPLQYTEITKLFTEAREKKLLSQNSYFSPDPSPNAPANRAKYFC